MKQGLDTINDVLLPIGLSYEELLKYNKRFEPMIDELMKEIQEFKEICKNGETN